MLDELLTDTESVLERAFNRLAAQRARAGAGGEELLWERWERLLAGPMVDLAAVMIGRDEDAKLLRSTTPFVGIVDEARRTAALEASKAA